MSKSSFAAAIVIMLTVLLDSAKSFDYSNEDPLVTQTIEFKGGRYWVVNKGCLSYRCNLVVTKPSCDLNEQPYTQEIIEEGGSVSYLGYAPASANFSLTWTDIVNGDRTVFEWRSIGLDEYISIYCVQSSDGHCYVTLVRGKDWVRKRVTEYFKVPFGQRHDFRLKRTVVVMERVVNASSSVGSKEP